MDTFESEGRSHILNKRRLIYFIEVFCVGVWVCVSVIGDRCGEYIGCECV